MEDKSCSVMVVPEQEGQAQNPSQSSWQRYDGVHALPFPCINTTKWFQSSLRKWYGIRWWLLQPFYLVFLRWKRSELSYGEAFVVYPFFAALVAWTLISFLNNEVDESGTPPTLALLVVYLLACHNSIVTLLIGLPLERALWFHKVAANVALITGALHGATYLNTHASMNQSKENDADGDDKDDDDDDGDDDEFSTWRVYSGYLLLALLATLILTSQAVFRRKMFEFFYASHWMLFLCIVPVALAHGAGAILLGFNPWFLDVVYRYGIQAKRLYPRRASLQLLPAQVVQCRFETKDLRYKAGQYVFLCVPSLSCWEWHPFSLSSAPSDDEKGFATLHIRALGNWTTTLMQSAKRSDHLPVEIDILMEGPYGEPSIDIESERHSCFLMISGGIGITPLQSLTNELWHQYQKGRSVKKCWFVWAVRDRFMIDAMYQASKQSCRPSTGQIGNVENKGDFSGEHDNTNSAVEETFHPQSQQRRESEKKIKNEQEAQAETKADVNANANAKEEMQHDRITQAMNVENQVDVCATAEDSSLDSTPQKCQASQRLPFSFVPEGLNDALLTVNGNETNSPFYTEFYLTQPREASEYAQANIHPERQPNLRFHRPDLDRIVQEMHAFAARSQGIHRVAVLVCGPREMIEQVRGVCQKHSTDQVRIELHVETFDF